MIQPLPRYGRPAPIVESTEAGQQFVIAGAERIHEPLIQHRATRHRRTRPEQKGIADLPLFAPPLPL